MATESPEREASASILVVDDSRVNRMVMRGLLAKAGYGVVEAGDGRAAVDLCLKCKPALVIMDVHMPEMDGMTAIHELRRRYSKTELPILLSTGDSKIDEDTCAEAGINGMLTKPLVVEEFYGKVRALLAA